MSGSTVPARVRVGILEDHAATRDYLERIVIEAEDFELTVSVDTVAAAQESLRAPADLYLVDLQLPDGHGNDFIRNLRTRYPNSMALVLTSLGDRESVDSAFASGASGYLLKETPAQRVIEDMRAVTHGGVPISPLAARHLLARLAAPAQRVAVTSESILEHALTPRETDVLMAFAKGLSYADTADALSVSVHTVRHYVREIYRKLSVHSRNEAVFEAIQLGLIRV